MWVRVRFPFVNVDDSSPEGELLRVSDSVREAVASSEKLLLEEPPDMEGVMVDVCSLDKL